MLNRVDYCRLEHENGYSIKRIRFDYLSIDGAQGVEAKGITMANITIMTGDQAGASFEIASRPLSLGRDPSRDIQIMDMKVSRKHAVIRFSDPNHVVAPMKSMNALLVNGEEVTTETLLNEGDEIMLGDTVLRYSLQSSPDYTNALNHAKVTSRKARDANTMM